MLGAPSLMAAEDSHTAHEIQVVTKPPDKAKTFRLKLAREMRRLHRLAGQSVTSVKADRFHHRFRARAHAELMRLHKAVRIERIRRSTVGYVSSREWAWLCIHRGEGAWNSATGNGYYGGLQMDYSFMATYGPEFLRRYGPANNWPWRIQILVADRAWQSRGFSPWPQTARACGLL